MRHPYTEALLASIPKVDQDARHRLYSIPGLPPELTGTLTGCRFAPRCRYAQPDCRERDPVLGGADPAHEFACFHPTDTSAADIEAIDEIAETEVPAATAAAATTTAAAVGRKHVGGRRQRARPAWPAGRCSS